MKTKQNVRVRDLQSYTLAKQDHLSCASAQLNHRSCSSALPDPPILQQKILGSVIPYTRDIDRTFKTYTHTFSKWMISFVCLLLLILQTASPCTAQVESSSLRFDTTVVNNHSDCAFIIELNDTTIQAFEVGLSTRRDTIDIFLHEILYDPTSGLPQDFTYQRNGQVITLGIGNRERLGYYYGQIRAKNSLGVWSDPYQFLQN